MELVPVPIPLRLLLGELLDLVEDVADRLGTLAEIDYVRTMLKDGSSADRQLRVFHETGSMKAVIDMLAEETVMGC